MKEREIKHSPRSSMLVIGEVISGISEEAMESPAIGHDRTSENDPETGNQHGQQGMGVKYG
jgi:hypothetical protein